jgi:TP901 family phage tail tape measure protein
LAALANVGIKGSQAGTSLRRIISELGASGKPTSEALKDLAAQGLNLADAKDEVGRSAQSALLKLTAQLPLIDAIE